MRFIYYLLLAILLFPWYSCANSQHSHRSQYTGQEKRAIKSLSTADIKDLRNGAGWGLAKAAELNGVPGPVHLLEMKNEISLSADQIKQIEGLYREMKSQAIPLGLELIELENKLNKQFASNTITESSLKTQLEKIAQVRSQLRFVHLSAHLKTPEILSHQQIQLYKKLRGYSSGDPCQNIPKGHDPKLWKKHNNCPQ
jgi:hypothetical protein